MPTLVFTTDLRDMNPDDLADKLAAQFNLTTLPVIGIVGTEVTITHAQATEQNRTAIQNVINTYSLDTTRTALPPGLIGTLLSRANAGLQKNTDFLALGATPTAAQVRDQTIVLTKENTAVIKALLAVLAGQMPDTSGT